MDFLSPDALKAFLYFVIGNMFHPLRRDSDAMVCNRASCDISYHVRWRTFPSLLTVFFRQVLMFLHLVEADAKEIEGIFAFLCFGLLCCCCCCCCCQCYYCHCCRCHCCCCCCCSFFSQHLMFWHCLETKHFCLGDVIKFNPSDGDIFNSFLFLKICRQGALICFRFCHL